MIELSMADVEVAINKGFEKWLPRIIEECAKNNALSQAQCEAYHIFKERENVKCFFTTKDDLEQHIQMHKTNEVKSDKRQGMIVKILTSSVIIQAVWNLLQWKHR